MLGVLVQSFSTIDCWKGPLHFLQTCRHPTTTTMMTVARSFSTCLDFAVQTSTMPLGLFPYVWYEYVQSRLLILFFPLSKGPGLSFGDTLYLRLGIRRPTIVEPAFGQGEGIGPWTAVQGSSYRKGVAEPWRGGWRLDGHAEVYPQLEGW